MTLVYVVSGYTDLGDGCFNTIYGVHKSLDTATVTLKEAVAKTLKEIYADSRYYPKGCLSTTEDKEACYIYGDDDAYIEGLLSEITITQQKLEI